MIPSSLVIEAALILVLMGLSTEALTRGVESLEQALGQGMAAGVILGNVTALPETLIVLTSVLEHKGEIALGSAIAGNVVIFTLGLGLISVIYFLKWKGPILMKGDYSQELKVMGAASLVLALGIIVGELNIIFTLLFFSIYIYYLVFRFRRSSRGKTNVKGVIQIIVGGSIIVVLSPIFVESIVELSTSTGLSETLIALILTPVVAELGEGISSVRLATRYPGGGSAAVVSYFGSKIQNATILLGLVGLDSTTTKGPFLILALVSNVIGILVVKDGKLSYLEGIALCVLYFVLIWIAYVL